MTASQLGSPITVCRVYRCSEAGTIIAGLEAAGIPVFARDFHTLSLLQHSAIALGGIQIRVFSQDAPEVSDWLATIFDNQTSRTNLKPASLVLFLILGVSFAAPPPTGVFVSRPRARYEKIMTSGT